MKRLKVLPDLLLVLEQRTETWLDVTPGAHVLVLLLSPDQLGVGVLGYLSLDQIVWERRDLFHSVQGMGKYLLRFYRKFQSKLNLTNHR